MEIFFRHDIIFNLHLLQDDCQPFGYAVMEQQKLLGIMIGVTYQNFFYPINLFTRRSIVMGGPLVIDNNSSVLKFLIQQVSKLQKYKSIYIQIRNLWDTNLQKSDFEINKFVYEDHLDIIHDLTLSNELIKSNISKNKRGNINKSINKGTIFKEVNDF